MEVVVHKGLHVVIVILASLLAFVSILAYLRDGRKKFLFVCSAFLLFALRELILFSEVVLSYRIDVALPLVNAPLTHILSFLILILFSIGIFSK